MHQYESIDVEAESGSSSSSSGRSASNSQKAQIVIGCIGLLALVAFIGLLSGGGDAAVAAPLPIAMVQRQSTVSSSSPVASPLVTLSLLDKSKDNKDKDVAPEYKNVCLDPNYTKVTLKTATESTMVALFDDLHGEKKFEASDVIPVGHNFLVVFDNLFRIGRIDQNLAFRSPKHQLIPSSPKRSGDSGFEALVFVPETETIYVVVEAELQEKPERDPFHPASMDASAKDGEKKGDAASKKKEERDEVEAEEKKEQTEFHAIIEELKMPGLFADPNSAVSTRGASDVQEGYTMKDRCPCEYAFTSGNKGFEGAVHLHFNGLNSDDDRDSSKTDSTSGAAATLVMMGLCEGNHCEGGTRGREIGNGRVVLMVKSISNETNECIWKTVNILALPPTAAFSDYSAIAIIGASDSNGKPLPNQYTLAVTSQESSQVWIGRLKTGKAQDFSDWSLTDGMVYNFPRSGSCEIEYCNIEGISFLDDNMLVAVSDKMKGAGRQNYRCLQKDQSIHTFVLP